LHKHGGGVGGSERGDAVVGNVAVDGDGAGLRTAGVQGGGAAGAGDVAGACRVAVNEPASIGAAGVGGDVGGAAGEDGRGIGGAGNDGWVRPLHGEAGTAGGDAIFAAIAQVSGDDIGAGLQAGGVDLRGGIAARNFYIGGVPGVGDGALGTEIGAARSGGHGLGGKDFGRLHGTGSGRGKARLTAAEVQDEASLQAHTTEVGTWNRVGTKAVIGHCKVGTKKAQSNVAGDVDIQTAADQEPELVDIVEGVGSETMVADEHFKKWGEMLGAIGNLWAEGDIGE